MGIIRSASASVTHSTSSASYLMTWPDTPVDGELLVAVIAGGAQTTITPPAGWVLRATQDSGDAQRGWLYTKTASSEPGNYTWTLGSATKGFGWMGAYAGADPASVVFASDNASSGTALSTPQVVVPGGGWLISVGVGRHTNTGAVTTWAANDDGNDVKLVDFGSNVAASYDVDGVVYDTGRARLGSAYSRVLIPSQNESTAMTFAVAFGPASGAPLAPAKPGTGANRWGVECLSGTAPSVYDRAVLDAGPVLYLPLTNTSSGLADLSGRGHNGTGHGALAVDSGPGDGPPAIVFNGTSGYVEVPDHDDFSVATTGVLTVECWMSPAVLDFPVTQPTDGSTPGNYYVYWAGKLGTHGETTEAEWASRMYNYTSYRPNRVSGYCFNNTGNLGAGSFFQDSLVAGQWIHYVLVINTLNVSSGYPTGYTKVYRDGVLRDKDSLAEYSIIPTNSTAPLRIGSATLESFFQGRIGRYAIYNYELSPTAVRDHYRVINPVSPSGISLVRHVADAAVAASGTKIQLVVGASGVQAGHTLLCTVSHPYTSGSPAVADSRGNTYTVDKTSSDSPGNTVRSSLVRGRIDTPLQAGDIIEVTTAAVAARTVLVDEFSGISYTSPLDQVSSITGVSTTPGSSTSSSAQITTTNADDLLYASTMVAGPDTDGYTEDDAHFYQVLSAAGTNTGGTDITTHAAWQTVTNTGTFKHQPVLGTSRRWMNILAGYKAGAAVPTPPASGSTSYVGAIGTASSTTSGTTLVVTVQGEGVMAGHTAHLGVMADYTTNGPVVTDSRGNTWQRDRQAADGSTTYRAALYSCPVVTALLPGDTITLTFSTAVTRKAAAAFECFGVAGPITIDVQNGASGSSTSPVVNFPTTTNADDMLVAVLATAGPSTDVITEDVVHQWQPAGTVGTSGSGAADRTVHLVCRPVGATGTYQYAPTVDNSRGWIALAVAYKAGPNTVTPPDAGASVHVKSIDAQSANSSGTTVVLTVPTGGVPIGHTLLLRFGSDYTASVPTVTDSRGNTWTVDRSGVDTGHNLRVGVASAAVTSGLLAGDTITVTWGSAVTHRAAGCDEWSAVLTPTVVNVTNGSSGVSATPTVSATTTIPDCLLMTAVSVGAPSTGGWTDDTANYWTSLAVAGTSGEPTASADRTVHAAYRGVTSAHQYTYAPTAGESVTWAAAIVAYRVD